MHTRFGVRRSAYGVRYRGFPRFPNQPLGSRHRIQVLLAIANVLFFVFHTALILFNVFGWIPKVTRKWNLLTLGLTAFSWCVMGIWKGVGYCLCTDWHWQIREAMGIHETANSYLVLLVRSISGWDPPVSLVNTVAGVVMALAVLASATVNTRDYLRERNERLGGYAVSREPETVNSER